MPRDCEELVLLLLREGNRCDAIKLYQEETGAYSDEAREAISRLAALRGLGRRGALMLAVLATAILSSLAVIVAQICCWG